MYNVIFNNNYHLPLYLDQNSNPSVPASGGSQEFPNWGSHIMNVPGMGDLNFIDLGDNKLPQYTEEGLPWTHYTWGGLIRFNGLDVYWRYEGEPTITITVDQYGSAQVNVGGSGMIVEVDDLTTAPE